MRRWAWLWFVVVLVAGAVPSAARAGAGAQAAPLGSLLPTAGELGRGLEVAEEGERTLEELAATFLDPAEAAALLGEWGWQANAYRTFTSADGAASGRVETSLHRFASIEGAAEAMPYFAEGRAAALGLELALPSALDGEPARIVSGEVAEGQEATVYVRRGLVLARVTAVQAEGDPTPGAQVVARRLLGSWPAAGGRPSGVPPSPAPTAGAATGPADDCAAVLAWMRESDPRVQTLNAVLAMPALNETTAGSSPLLTEEEARRYADLYTALAEEQRASAPPPSAVALNGTLVETLDLLASAMGSYLFGYYIGPLSLQAAFQDVVWYQLGGVHYGNILLIDQVGPLMDRCELP